MEIDAHRLLSRTFEILFISSQVTKYLFTIADSGNARIKKGRRKHWQVGNLRSVRLLQTRSFFNEGEPSKTYTARVVVGYRLFNICLFCQQTQQWTRSSSRRFHGSQERVCRHGVRPHPPALGAAGVVWETAWWVAGRPGLPAQRPAALWHRRWGRGVCWWRPLWRGSHVASVCRPGPATYCLARRELLVSTDVQVIGNRTCFLDGNSSHALPARKQVPFYLWDRSQCKVHDCGGRSPMVLHALLNRKKNCRDSLVQSPPYTQHIAHIVCLHKQWYLHDIRPFSNFLCKPDFWASN